MGKCFSVQSHDNIDEICDKDMNQEENSIKNKLNANQKKIQKGKNKYKSSLLNSNLNKQIIFEEESYAISSVIQSFQFEDLETLNKKYQDPSRSMSSQMKSASILTINQKQIMKLYNIGSQSYLHSHVVKYEIGSKQNEVCTCKDGQHDYDNWLIIADHTDQIQDQNIVIFHHLLTNNIMRADSKYKNEKSKLFQVCCVNSLKDLRDQDYWKIEFHSFNQISLTIKIKHVLTDSYLQVSNNSAIIKTNYEVGVGPLNDSLDVWQIVECN